MMDFRLAFNEVADIYDKWRPKYISEIYADIMAYSSLNSNSHVLEIGIGTGHATLPILETKCHVTAIEIGDNLTTYTREKFSGYKNLEVLNTSFEEYECHNDSFDLIYSASAFHWIHEEIGYPKVYSLLKSGGTFALFDYTPYVDKKNESLNNAVKKVYAKYMPEDKPTLEYTEEMCKNAAEIAAKYDFIDISYKMYHRIRSFDAEGYSMLIKTYSTHRALGEKQLALLTNELKKTINSFGGKMNIYDILSLRLAKKP